MMLLVGQVPRDTIGREAFQEVDYRQHVRARWRSGWRRSTTPRGMPGARSPARCVDGMLGAARARRDGAARGHAHRRPPTCPTPRRVRDRRRARPRRDDVARAARAARRAPSARWSIVGEGGWTRAGRRRRRAPSPRRRAPGRGLVPLPGLRRQRLARATPATSASAIDPALAKRIPRPTCCSRRRAPGRHPDGGLHAARTAAPAPAARPRPSRSRGARARLPARPGDRSRARARSRRAARDARAGRAAGDWPRAAHAEYERNMLEHRELPGRAADSPTSCAPARAPARRRDPHQRRRQLHGLGASLLRLPRATRRSSRRRSGAMGYGIPAAVAAKAVHPERDVVCVAGDGDFLMTGQELATAVPVRAGRSSSSSSTTACTARSACTRSATTRGASSATDLGNPDFAASRARSAPTASSSSAPRTSPPAFERGARGGRPGAARAARRSRGDHAAPTLSEIREAAG